MADSGSRLPSRARPGRAAAFEIGAADLAASPFAAVAPRVRDARRVGADPAGPRDASDPSGGQAGRQWALALTPGLAPHPALDTLMRLSLPSVLLPLGRRVASGAEWLVCHTPDGDAVPDRLPRPSESFILTSVLRPISAALNGLAQAGFTHRAIRPANVFLRPASGIATLGPFWLEPPAFRQPAVAEAPWVAVCRADARGHGTAADDVYALGVLILRLCLGDTALDGLPDEEVIDRKVRLGSVAALIGDRRLTPSLTDLFSAMLADEPSQRPPLVRLAEGLSIVGPKVVSRRLVRSTLPLTIDDTEIWTTPQLALHIARQPESGRRALLLGQVNQWLRRSLNETVLAEKLDAVVRPPRAVSRLDSKDQDQVAAVLLSAIRLLDPTAPLVWRGISVMPDGIAPLLARLEDLPPPEAAAISSAITTGLLAFGRTEEDESARFTIESTARALGTALRTPLGRLFSAYEFNPTLACGSPLLAEHRPATLSDLLSALDAIADGARLDPWMVAFAAARGPSRRPPSGMPRGFEEEVRLLASLCHALDVGPLHHLTRAIGRAATDAVTGWPGRTGRAARIAAIEEASRTGDLEALRAVIEDRTALRADAGRQAEARAQLHDLRRRRDALIGADRDRSRAARRVGRDGMSVLGTAVSAAVLLAQVLG